MSHKKLSTLKLLGPPLLSLEKKERMRKCSSGRIGSSCSAPNWAKNTLALLLPEENKNDDSKNLSHKLWAIINQVISFLSIWNAFLSSALQELSKKKKIFCLGSSY